MNNVGGSLDEMMRSLDIADHIPALKVYFIMAVILFLRLQFDCKILTCGIFP